MEITGTTFTAAGLLGIKNDATSHSEDLPRQRLALEWPYR